MRIVAVVWLFGVVSLVMGCGQRPPLVLEEITPISSTVTVGTSYTTATTDWPCWRGPQGDGKSLEARVPSKWSTTENVLWKADVPGRGHASPIVFGDRIFLTTADEQTQKQFVLAFDRTTGEKLWTCLANEGGFMPKHGKNSHASATPACDGERVYSVFINHDSLHVTATDLVGTVVWQTAAGPFTSEHGYGSSPVLYKSLVIVSGESLKSSFLAALDASSGQVIWRTARKFSGQHGNYATPIVGDVAGKPQLLTTGMDSISSYDPETGKLIWTCAGASEVTACTIAFSKDLVFASGGFPNKELLAIRGDGAGNVSNSHVAWRTGKGVTYVPSPLYQGGHLYVVNDGGVATCFEAATGKQVWQERLEGNFSASPVLVGDRIYVTNEAGRTFVLRAGRKFEVIAQNDLGDGGFASPAICGDQILVRTEHRLYCIGKPAG